MTLFEILIRLIMVLVICAGIEEIYCRTKNKLFGDLRRIILTSLVFYVVFVLI